MFDFRFVPDYHFEINFFRKVIELFIAYDILVIFLFYQNHYIINSQRSSGIELYTILGII